MFELSKQFRFDAAHTLECEAHTEANRRIHGHSYRAEVTVRGEPDKKSGMLIDLGVFERVLGDAREALDHRMLNDVENLGPPTLENLSAWIWRQLAPNVKNLAKVAVYRDGSGDACIYHGPGKAAGGMSRALVLFSGGQDSTVCLAWALQQFDEIETIGFDYGQRHHIELECRTPIREKLAAQFPNWKNKLGGDQLIDIKALGAISETALTRDAEISFEKNGLPNTFVPGRNLLFFTYAAAVGYRRDIENLVGGMCETDYSGYPDCREKTLQALQTAINLGTDKNFKIHTPLMQLTKAATWELAQKLGGDALVNLIINETHTCYVGERGQRHDWGLGCGACPACTLRANGWNEWRAGRKAA